MTVLALVHMMETLLGTSDEIEVVAIAGDEGTILTIKAMMASIGIPIEFDNVSHVIKEKIEKVCCAFRLFILSLILLLLLFSCSCCQHCGCSSLLVASAKQSLICEDFVEKVMF